MLDDLKYIHGRDKSDALGVAEKQWQQLQQQYQVSISAQKIENVVVAGMGGSALAATLIPVWLKIKVPFEVVRGYNAPSYTDKNTLFIASSYSGNTEETLSALSQAEEHGAIIAVISAGGKLAEIAKSKGYPFYELPKNFQPRMAVFYNLSALVYLFSEVNLVNSGVLADLKLASEFLKEQCRAWLADVPTSQNQAKQIALDIVGKSPVIYGGLLFAGAYKWKINFNENAKNVAWCGQLPEFNHNEFLGWSSHPVEKPYAPIFLQSSFDHPQVAKRFDISARLLSGQMPSPIIVNAKGKTILEQLLWVVTLGDFISLYTALLNNLDPTPVDLIEKLKKELA